MTSMILQENEAGNGHENAVKNHCEANSTGDTPYSCIRAIASESISRAQVITQNLCVEKQHGLEENFQKLNRQLQDRLEH